MQAKAYIRAQGAPIVVKADGLAAGKGVVVAMSEAEALAAVDMMFGGGLGDAGAEVVVEEFMTGEEASFFALCDGEHALPLATAQDHKRAFDGDQGPNTGGMGAYSPAPVLTEAVCTRIMEEMIYPTLRALKKMGSPYKGVLYAGVMMTKDGPKLVEYNARFGDPETQVLMLRMMSDIVPALIACADGQLKNFSLRWFDDVALTVIMATKGYPGDYGKGFVIEGLDEAAAVEGVEIFHAGTRAERWQDSVQWRAGAEHLRDRQDGHRGAAARLCRGRQDQLAGRFLPPRHRLAGDQAGAGTGVACSRPPSQRHCEEPLRRSNPTYRPKKEWIASLRSQ